MLTSQEIKEKIIDKLDQCYRIAEEMRGQSVPQIRVDWSLKGKVAGEFCEKYSEKYFRFNLGIARDNFEEYIRKTIPHEFAHYIQRLNDTGYYRSKPHGREWQMLMIQYFGLEPTRCHSYNVDNCVQRRGPRFVYKCHCSEHTIGPVQHRRAQSGISYICKRCRSNIKWTGNTK